MFPTVLFRFLPVLPMIYGAALAQTAVTKPAGYETIVTQGYGYLGARLMDAPVAAGTVTTVGTGDFTDAAANFTTALAGAGKPYVIEFSTTPEIAEIVTSASVTGATTMSISAAAIAGISNGTVYRIRPAATIASFFGAANTAGIAPGHSGPAKADILFVREADSSQSRYFYDADRATWANAKTNAPVDPATVALSLEGFRLLSAAPVSVVVIGELKTKPVSITVKAGYNYLSSVYPVGATLANAFSASLAEIHKGAGNSTGADQVFVPGTGGSTAYYYDSNASSWADAATGTPVDAATIELPSGVLYFNAGAAFTLQSTPPEGYADL